MRALYNEGLLASDFDYELPKDRIAQHPLPERSASRMLILDRQAGSWTDAQFRDLPEWVGKGDCLAVNNSRVLAARLRGRRRSRSGATSGGTAEILLLEPDGSGAGQWRALVRPGRKLAHGSIVDAGGAAIHILGRAAGGARIVTFPGLDDAAVEDLLEAHGHVPLPPYIRRPDDRRDRERYQCVFARERGSVAAPTAGLHFDEALLEELRGRGTVVAELTLHVGLGTFRPVTVERVEDHRLDAERFELGPAAAAAIQKARRTIAVGTTSVRVLESVAAGNEGAVRPMRGATDLFIAPGYRFQAVDALLTNFHLPKSTLLMLVAAFAGREFVREAYAHAVREGYRFYSYGDCMLIV